MWLVPCGAEDLDSLITSQEPMWLVPCGTEADVVGALWYRGPGLLPRVMLPSSNTALASWSNMAAPTPAFSVTFQRGTE